MIPSQLLRYTRQLAWKSSARVFSLSAFVIILFLLIQSLTQGKSLSIKLLFIGLWYSLSEALAFLSGIALFHYLKSFDQHKESHLTSLYTHHLRFQTRSLWPFILIMTSYSLLYQTHLKPNFKHALSSGQLQETWHEQQDTPQFAEKFTDGMLWLNPKNDSPINAIYHYKAKNLNSWISSKSFDFNQDTIHFKEGSWYEPSMHDGLKIQFDHLQFSPSQQKRRDKEKTFGRLLNENGGWHRLQIPLSHGLAPFFIIAYTLFILLKQSTFQTRHTAYFLFGLFLVYLPLQLLTRKLSFQNFAFLTYLNWLAPLSLLVYASFVNQLRVRFK